MTHARRRLPHPHDRYGDCAARHRYFAVRGAFMHGCDGPAGSLFAARGATLTVGAALTALRFFFEIAR